jgi:phosphohistidine phosphatase
MLVFLVRHGHADPGEPDELRPLSARGLEEAEAVAGQLAAHPTPPILVLTSPTVRARATAAEIARAVKAELEVDVRLAPGATLDSLRSALAGRAGPVATVGHQPDCSEIAKALTDHDPGFKPGGFAELTLET